MTMKNKISIILADSEYLIRVGLRYFINSRKDMKILDEAIDHADLMEQMKKHKPDVVVVDYNQPRNFSKETITAIKKSSPQTNILVISADDDKQSIYEVLEAGTNSFLTKSCDEDEIIGAIKATAKGERFFCNKVLNYIMQRSFPEGEEDCSPVPLSDRECEVVKLVAEGLVAKQIAAQLNLSTHTVYTHRKNIMKKLGIGSTSELVLYAVNHGIISK